MNKICLIILTCCLSFLSAEDAMPVPGPVQTSEQIVIQIHPNREIILNGTESTLAELTVFFQSEPENPNTPVLVFAQYMEDEAFVLQVMQICCNYKYTNVRLIYQEPPLKS